MGISAIGAIFLGSKTKETASHYLEDSQKLASYLEDARAAGIAKNFSTFGTVVSFAGVFYSAVYLTAASTAVLAVAVVIGMIAIHRFSQFASYYPLFNRIDEKDRSNIVNLIKTAPVNEREKELKDVIVVLEKVKDQEIRSQLLSYTCKISNHSEKMNAFKAFASILIAHPDPKVNRRTRVLIDQFQEALDELPQVLEHTRALLPAYYDIELLNELLSGARSLEKGQRIPILKLLLTIKDRLKKESCKSIILTLSKIPTSDEQIKSLDGVCHAFSGNKDAFENIYAQIEKVKPTELADILIFFKSENIAVTDLLLEVAENIQKEKRADVFSALRPHFGSFDRHPLKKELYIETAKYISRILEDTSEILQVASVALEKVENITQWISILNMLTILPKEERAEAFPHIQKLFIEFKWGEHREIFERVSAFPRAKRRYVFQELAESSLSWTTYVEQLGVLSWIANKTPVDQIETVFTTLKFIIETIHRITRNTQQISDLLVHISITKESRPNVLENTKLVLDLIQDLDGGCDSIMRAVEELSFDEAERTFLVQKSLPFLKQMPDLTLRRRFLKTVAELRKDAAYRDLDRDVKADTCVRAAIILERIRDPELQRSIVEWVKRVNVDLKPVVDLMVELLQGVPDTGQRQGIVNTLSFTVSDQLEPVLQIARPHFPQIADSFLKAQMVRVLSLIPEAKRGGDLGFVIAYIKSHPGEMLRIVRELKRDPNQDLAVLFS